MTVDVIIPLYCPGKKFFRLLQRLTEQTARPRRILLLHTEQIPSFTDKELIKQLKNLHGFIQDGENLFLDGIPLPLIAIRKEEFDHGGTRRFGAEQSDADFLLFMTHDVVPADTKLIEALLRSFEDEDVAVAYARQKVDANARKKERIIQEYNYPKESRKKCRSDLPKLGIKTYFCSDVCAMYRKKAYLEAGGFLKKTIFNEDMIMAYHLVCAGYSIAYVADPAVIHYHRYTFVQQFRRNFDLAVSQAEHPEVFSDISSESEGFRFVKRVLRCLISGRAYGQAVEFFLECIVKYAGFLFGKHYRSLPKSLLLKFTSNKMYWS